MKKTIGLMLFAAVLSALLVLSGTPFGAADGKIEPKETVEHKSVLDEDERRGFDFLLSTGVSEDMAELIDLETLSKLGRSTGEYNQVISYYVEGELPDGSSDMFRVSRDEFTSLGHDDLSVISQSMLNAAMQGWSTANGK